MRYLGRHLGRFRYIGRGITDPPTPPPPVSDWILATGYWDDSGIWVDTEVWID